MEPWLQGELFLRSIVEDIEWINRVNPKLRGTMEPWLQGELFLRAPLVTMVPWYHEV